MSKFHDKQRYIREVISGKSHRQIAKQINWSVSVTIIRNELIKEGVIVESYSNIDKTGRSHVFFRLTGKEVSNNSYCSTWEDGTPKSRGNAFDLSTAKGLFNKSELASSQNKGRPNNYNVPVQVIAYSRA